MFTRRRSSSRKKSDSKSEEKIWEGKNEIEMRRAIQDKIENIELILQQRDRKMSDAVIQKQVEEINEKISQEKIRKHLDPKVAQQLEQIMAKLNVQRNINIPGIPGPSEEVREICR